MNAGRRVCIYPDPQPAADFVGNLLFDQIRWLPTSSIGWATGSTMEPVLASFTGRAVREGLDTSRLTSVNMDEHLTLDHLPVPVAHPLSYRGFMQTNLFRFVGIPETSIYFPVPDLARPGDPFHRYVDAIYRCGGLDIQLAGIGVKGHVAFNEAFQCDLDSVTRIITLDESTIGANKRFVGGDASQVPPLAGTIGIYELLNLNRLFVLCAFGDSKAEAVRAALEGPVSNACPASYFRWPYHRNTIWMLDRAAAKLLNPDGPYFKMAA